MGTDSTDGSDDNGSDEGPKLDMSDDPLPPDPFEPGGLGCDPAPMVGPMIEIDSAGAWIDELGLIRVRLLDHDPDAYDWDIRLDLLPADTLPATYLGIEFSGDLSEPAVFEWWHGSISGTVDLEVVSAELGGCLVAELQASSNDWDREAPPLGWIVTPLLPWPEDP
jgi:hypothetical protein